jgi:phosphoglycerol transferase MdoB-like AlkP superfamily enzyme
MAAGRFRFVLTFAGALALLLTPLALLIGTEQAPIPLIFTALVTMSIASFMAFLSRRVLFASAVTLSLAAAIYCVSYAKRDAMDMSFHSYDILFYTSGSTLAFLWSDYRSYILTAIVFLLCAAMLAMLAWRVDKLRCPRMVSAGLLLLAIVATAWVWPQAKAAVSPHMMFGKNHSAPIAAFYLSWSDTFNALTSGKSMAALESAARTTLPRFAISASCTPSQKPPHIVLIHQESLYPLSIFPKVAYDRALDRFFLSGDNRLHKLRVETYGGASWVTDFSIFTGISARSFGYVRPFVPVFMRGRLKETLPQWLGKCGYRNVMFFPFDGNFLALDKFYKSIGFDDAFDRNAQGLTSWHERDRVYFQNALNAIERNLAARKGPLFIYVQTMTAHGPFNSALAPEENVAGGGPGTSAELSEYLRRVAIVAKDGDFLIDELKRRFPGERFLIARFGDHQPQTTRELLNLPPDPRILVDWTETPDAFITFYALSGVNFAVPKLPDYDVLDVPFLDTVILDAAGLPLTEAQQERKRLMLLCAGQYFECKHREEILTFHRRLIDSWIVQTE